MQIQHHALISPAPGTQRELVSLHYGQPGGAAKAYIQASLHADELPGMLVAHHLRNGGPRVVLRKVAQRLRSR